MDWTAFSLSLQLAAWTVALLLPVAILIARLLAWGDFRGKSFVEALIMLPLVLPPTVLGFYLLVGLLAAVGVRRLRPIAVRRQARLQLRRHPRRLADRQPAVRRAADPARLRGDPAQRARSRLRLRAVALGDDAAHRAAARLAGHRLGHGADLRAHAGRVRRHPHDRRQHPGRDARAVDLDLRQRAGLPHRAGGRHVGGAARLLARRHRHRAHAGAPPEGRRA